MQSIKQMFRITVRKSICVTQIQSVTSVPVECNTNVDNVRSFSCNYRHCFHFLITIDTSTEGEYLSVPHCICS